MFCYECGKQVMDGSAFCSFCGAKFENVVSKNDQQSVTKTSTEYDREAIKIYLNNLLQMENANQVLQHELNRLADEFSNELNTLGVRVAKLEDRVYYMII